MAAEQEQRANDYFAGTELDLWGKHLKRFYAFEEIGLPVKQSGRLFHIENGILHVDGEPLIEPPEGWAFAGFVPSADATRLAYGLQEKGADWQEWYICEVQSGARIDGPIKWIKFEPPAWDSEGTGLYYAAFLPPMEGEELSAPLSEHQLRYHKLGRSFEEDQLLATFANGMLGSIHPTADDKQLIVSLMRGGFGNNGIGVIDLNESNGVREIIPPDQGTCSFVGELGDEWLVLTSHNAPMGQVVAIDPEDAQHERVVIGEQPHTLVEVRLVGGKLVAVYLVDVISEVWVYDLNGQFESKLDLPGQGIVSRPWGGVGLRGRLEDSELLFPYMDTTQPLNIFAYDLTDLSHRALSYPRASMGSCTLHCDPVLLLKLRWNVDSHLPPSSQGCGARSQHTVASLRLRRF